ncbi:GA-like domain-containing protein, partial [Acinetobacter sp. DSM 11652]|uniref:GA-like domain-containing protein n=1 Tax=Acinetobacter sp. DSM 11652 TaxID=346222 RepID=UPI0008C9D50F
MKNLEILSKNDGAVLEKTTANKIVLNQNSIVKIDASIEEVLNFEKEGNSLVINFKNGEQLVVESYFEDPLNSHNILFNDNGQLYWVEFTDAANEIASTIKYYPIDDISALIAGNSSTVLTGLTPWLIAGGLAAGVVAIADNMSDSDKKSNSVSPEPEPPINDELEEAKQLVNDAEKAYQDLKDLIEDKLNDGLITPEEKAELEEALQDAKDAKDAAQDKVDNLVDGEAKSDLQDRLDDLVDEELPAINDQNGDGVPDDLEQALLDAEEAVANAEQAYEALKDLILEKNENGLITPAERAELDQAKEAFESAKALAETKTNLLPESVQSQKDALQERLEDLVDIILPEINDENDDGIVDDIAEALIEAELAVAEAEAKYAAAENALTVANRDGLINPTELNALQNALEQAQIAKSTAQSKVNALPESVQEQKDAFQNRLDDLTDISLPEVNDADGDGIVDGLPEAIQEAQSAVEEAEAKYAEALNNLALAQKDGLINPLELSILEQKVQAALDAKEVAQDKVNVLPNGAIKDGLQDRLDALVNIDLPEVNDADGDGVPDGEDITLEEATEAVEAAEAAYAEAEQALADAESDGLITPTELTELTQARDDALAAKEDAQAKVDALPEGADKDALDARLDDLVDITLPTVNDENEDGIADEYEQVLADAEAAVEAAEAAYAAAEQALIDANANGLIT